MLDGGPTVGIAQTCDIAANDTELWSIQCLYQYEVRRVNITAMTGTTIANAPNETLDETAAGTLAMGVDTIYFIGSDHVFSVPRTTAAATPQTLPLPAGERQLERGLRAAHGALIGMTLGARGSDGDR